jgi:hypothetical protein
MPERWPFTSRSNSLCQLVEIRLKLAVAGLQLSELLVDVRDFLVKSGGIAFDASIHLAAEFFVELRCRIGQSDRCVFNKKLGLEGSFEISALFGDLAF